MEKTDFNHSFTDYLSPLRKANSDVNDAHNLVRIGFKYYKYCV